MPRPVLVGGVGYRHLRDHSVGVVVSDRLEAREWPDHVRVQDLSFNPVAVSQQLQEDLSADDVLVLVSAVGRGRPPGTVVAYRWDGELPDAGRVQDAVAEAVTGVIALDNTLMVTRQFGGLPQNVVVVEIEPAEESFGDELSDAVAAGVGRMVEVVERVALDPATVERIPVAPLGGGAVPRVRLS